MTLDLIIPGITLAVLFVALRNIEMWLHRHLFKVGWLVTKNYQSTTILYYTFFLPGVFLHELVYWLAAGVLDVRAEGGFKLPEAQEIGELKLNFIRLSKKASPVKVAVISAAPTIAGLFIIWWVATNIFDIRTFLETIRPGTLDAVSAGITQLTTTQDFWLWTYFVFAVSNTMMPTNTKSFSAWRPFLLALVVIGVVVLVAGFADEVFGALYDPLMNGINALSVLFFVILLVNGVGLAALAAIENTIELVTGDSATFKNGKMIAMRRSEVLALKEQERQKIVKQRQQKLAARTATPALSAGGVPSVYKLPLPIPGTPGEISVTPTATALIEPEKPVAALPERPRREEPTMIEGTATPAAPRPAPLFNPGRKPAVVDEDLDDDEDAEEDDEGVIELTYEDVDDVPPEYPEDNENDEEANEDR